MTPLTTADHLGPTEEYHRVRHTIIDPARRSSVGLQSLRGNPACTNVTITPRITLPPNGTVKEEIRGGVGRQIQGYIYLASSFFFFDVYTPDQP